MGVRSRWACAVLGEGFFKRKAYMCALGVCICVQSELRRLRHRKPPICQRPYRLLMTVR